jgi:hypothetical protein
MEWLKIFTLAMGFGLLLGAVIVVSVDVYRESERHRLLTRAPRYSAHRGVAPRV